MRRVSRLTNMLLHKRVKTSENTPCTDTPYGGIPLPPTAVTYHATGLPLTPATSHATVEQRTLRKLQAAQVKLFSVSLTMAKDRLASACNFDFLFYRNFPHILEMIFLSLDYESYKNCAEVSNEWKALLSSERYKSKGKTLFKQDILKDEETLISAASMGNTHCVRRLLATGMVDVNAAKWGEPVHREVAKLLIESGADLNVPDRNGRTPLHWCIKLGNEEVSNLLVEAGAELNLADRHGVTPLHEVALSGSTMVAQLLIDCDADLNVTDNDLRTPLHHSSMWGEAHHEEVAKLLIASGAELNVADRHENTPLHEAALSGHNILAQLLIKAGAEFKAPDKDGRTLLHKAAMWGELGHREVAKLLIESGADVNAADRGGRTPLDFASTPHVAQLLIGGGGKGSGWGRGSSTSRVSHSTRLT